MFEMMNRERLATGMMGIGLAEIAYQNALSWAKDRRQGRDIKGTQILMKLQIISLFILMFAECCWRLRSTMKVVGH
jgi:alkylation response protein AidB-like acyl-CoA dehydrogenase